MAMSSFIPASKKVVADHNALLEKRGCNARFGLVHLLILSLKISMIIIWCCGNSFGSLTIMEVPGMCCVPGTWYASLTLPSIVMNDHSLSTFLIHRSVFIRYPEGVLPAAMFGMSGMMMMGGGRRGRHHHMMMAAPMGGPMGAPVDIAAMQQQGYRLDTTTGQWVPGPPPTITAPVTVAMTTVPPATTAPPPAAAATPAATGEGSTFTSITPTPMPSTT
jgi:hypothetical protein